MFLGLRTVVYHAPDLDRAKDWYTTLLGIAPYFDQPFYVGFSVGGFELGLDPNMDGVRVGNNAVAYWGVADIRAAHAHALSHGGTPHRPVTEVGDGITVASIADPFGNVLGLIENPHFAG